MAKWICTGLLLLTASGCFQTENSSSLNAQLASADAWRAVLSANCSNCHSYPSMTEAELIAAGLVIAGNPENSRIYYRLVGSTGMQGPKDMPQGGALSTSDLDIVAAWIESL